MKERERFRVYTIKCYENAVQFVQDAELLFAHQSYGHCYALLVLGLEEWSKAMTGFLFHLGFPRIADTELQSILKDHTWKQRFGLVMVSSFHVDYVIEESEMKEDYMKIVQGLAEGQIDLSTYGDEFFRLLKQDPSNAAQNLTQFFDVIDELAKNHRIIEERKHAGLYVEIDPENFSVTSPQDVFTKEQAAEYLETYKYIVNFTIYIIDVLKDHKKYEKELKMLYEAVEQIKQILYKQSDG